MNNKFTVKFWGVRGSHAVPGSQTIRYGGNTSCIEVQAGIHTLILDAGTGIIALGRSLLQRSRKSGKPVEAALFFSHLHHDHTQGFPFFTPAYVPGTRLHLFAWESQEHRLEKALSLSMGSPFFPVRLQELGAYKKFYGLAQTSSVLLGPNPRQVQQIELDRTIPNQALPQDAVWVRVHHSIAHPGGVLALRIEFGGKTIVYATDIEGYVGVDQNLAAFSQRADVLIHDAQYTDEHYCGQVPGLPATQGWGHSTVRMACALAQSAQAKKLVLFHHDPGYNDDLIAANETLARQLRPNSLAAYEGLEIEIGNENVPHQATKAAADEVKFPYLHSSPAANPGN